MGEFFGIPHTPVPSDTFSDGFLIHVISVGDVAGLRFVGGEPGEYEAPEYDDKGDGDDL